MLLDPSSLHSSSRTQHKSALEQQNEPQFRGGASYRPNERAPNLKPNSDQSPVIVSKGVFWFLSRDRFLLSCFLIMKNEIENENENENETDLLTTNQAAAYLQISPKTLWTHTQEGRLPSIKLGGLIRYRRQALIDTLVKMETQSTKK